MAFIAPVLKPGAPKCDASSYRPVSLTSYIIKAFDRIVKKVLQNHFDVTLTFNDQQHGFRSKRSRLCQLLSHYNEILKGMEEGSNLDTVNLEFSKDIHRNTHAYNERHGCSWKLALWIHSFLTDRKQVVIANGAKSTVSGHSIGPSSLSNHDK